MPDTDINSFIQTVSAVLNYSLVGIYGFLLSVFLCGGFRNRSEKKIMSAVCVGSLFVQGVSSLIFGLDVTFMIYPLICHVPLVLFLHFCQKRPWKLSIIAVLTSYFWCQIPRFLAGFAEWCFDSNLAYEIVYPPAIIAVFFLLKKYFCRQASETMTYSDRALVVFGIGPVFYYIFDYLTSVYDDLLNIGFYELKEVIPVVLAVYFLGAILLYHEEVQRRSAAEMQNVMMEMSLKRSETEIEALLMAQEKTAVYRHDTRHLLAMLSNLLESGNVSEALAYLGEAGKELENLIPRRVCENNSINVLLSAFTEKASLYGINIKTDVALPKHIPVKDIEICTLLSNALENAIRAVDEADTKKEITVSCCIRKDRFLLSVTNPYSGNVTMTDGVPVSDRPGHGFGVKSIKIIVSKHRGMVTFSAENGIFELRVVIPVERDENLG